MSDKHVVRVVLLVLLSTVIATHTLAFYNPTQGRWLTRDPLGEAGGTNLYAFVGNNSVNWLDPWGLVITYGGRMPYTASVLVGQLRRNPITADVIAYLDALPQNIHITHVPGQRNPGTDSHLTAGNAIMGTFPGADIGIDLSSEGTSGFIRELYPHIPLANSQYCLYSEEELDDILLQVALGHELTHAYDAAVNPRKHYLLQLLKRFGATGNELEIHPRQIEYGLFRHHWLPTGVEVFK